ncbi:fimbrial biogenesis usher protein [Providencia rettgeri]
MKTKKQGRLPYQLALTPFAIICLPIIVQANVDIYFNPRFLSDDPTAVADLTRFERGEVISPGVYRVDLYINNNYFSTRDIHFKEAKNKKGVIPCLNREQLIAMGVNPESVANVMALNDKDCIALDERIEGASTSFDVQDLKLHIHIPQAFMSRTAQGYIPPEMWDDGITAGILNYVFSGSNSSGKNAGNNFYLNLNSGLNIGAWRLRSNSIWNYTNNDNSYNNNKWQHVNTYAERAIIAIKSRLILGDGFTPSDIFTGVNFRGAQVMSDDNMLPDSQRGFAPVVRGIARSTALVSIKQNGFEIYQTNVPPGPFEINDIYPAGNAGDLQVTVREANGRTQSFTVPYSSVPGLLREGRVKYSATAGETRSGNRDQINARFIQATIQWGLKQGWTVFSGSQLSNKYRAVNIGFGKNLGGFGAFTFDITQASADLADNSSHQGHSMRFLYNKSLTDLGTNIQLAGYRYSTEGFYSLADTTYKRLSGYTIIGQDGPENFAPKFTDYYNLRFNKRGLLQLSITQQLGPTSSLYFSGSQQTYWDTDETDEQFQASYNTSIDAINYSLSYFLTKNAWQKERDQMLAVSVSIPFSKFLPSDSSSVFRNSSANYDVSNDLKGRAINRLGVSGTLLENNNLSYSVQQGYGNKGQNYNANLGVAYRGGWGTSNIGYSRNSGYNQVYYGVSGGILAHENGITLSQPINETAVLIQAPGAGNVTVENQTGVKTDSRGYAVLPYATEYRDNRVALNLNTLADNVELDSPVASVTPTRGAIVRANFHAQVGVKVLMTISHNGKPLPFGSIISALDGSSSSLVSDNGQVYLTGLPLEGTLIAKWGNDTRSQCKVQYKLSPDSQKKTLNTLISTCR